MDLEDLRGQELAEFGNIFPMLKNVSRVKAFGPLKDPVEAAINPIDSIIAYARHNALEMYDEGQLENLLKSIASRLSRNDLSANIYSNKFVDAAGNSKNLNLGDGDLDLCVSNFGPNYLWKQSESTNWEEVGVDRGIAENILVNCLVY